jgi:hypothetical protein
MARARAPALRRRRARAAARRGDDSLEAGLAHPVFDPVRSWLPGERTLERLNRDARSIDLKTESGQPVRFVAPGAGDASYEIKVHESGRVETRPDNLHDFFNALAWLAFPRTKARINALHAAEMPREKHGRRGPLRDLLTIFDEGGAIVHCDDPHLLALLRDFRWKELFWSHRDKVRAAMRIVVFGHAVLEKALEPWPGITCKAIVVPAAADPDAAASAWFERLAPAATPRDLAPLPVFGYPGWAPQDEAFYDDTRYFRPQPDR